MILTSPAHRTSIITKKLALGLMISLISAVCISTCLPAATAGKLDKKDIRDRFDYIPPAGLESFELVSKERGYNIYEGTIKGFNPIDGTPFPSSFFYYRSEKMGKRPLVLIQPVIRGITPVELGLAKFFASEGYHAFISKIPEDISELSRPMSDFDNFLLRATAAVRSQLDILVARAEVDENKIAAIGSSLGGIRTTLLLGVDPRPRAAMIYVAGGNIPYILAHTDQELLVNYRNHRMRTDGISSLKEYEQRVRSHMEIDPLALAPYIKTDRLQMVISQNDLTVPTSKQYELWSALGRPKAQVVGAGHVGSVITSYFHRKKILQFFKKKWDTKTNKSLGRFSKNESRHSDR